MRRLTLALLLVAAPLAAREVPAGRSRRRRERVEPLVSDPHLAASMPPREKPMRRGDALHLLRTVNVLDRHDGAWSLDIGGSLAKVAFFQPRGSTLPNCSTIFSGRGSGLAAESLSVPALGGSIHFVLFETRYMEDCIDFVDRFWVRGQRDGGERTREPPRRSARARLRAAAAPRAGGAAGGAASLAPAARAALPARLELRATGGGSLKYRAAFERIGVELKPRDEMRSMVNGLNFLLTAVEGEAFAVDGGDPLSPLSPEAAASLPRRYLPPSQDPFPYLFVSIGSGVSIIEVTGWGDKFRRVDGSSIGGGTFWALCRLLLRARSFDELIELTQSGVSSNVDMLVGDIYGGDCATHNLNRDVIAASFGKVVMRREDPRARRARSRLARALGRLCRLPRRARARVANSRLEEEFRAEDVALSLLRMVSNNIGQIACLNAQKYGLKRIFFGGSFIRNHPYTAATISNAVRFFSRGTVEAHFLKRESFVGALGALLDAEQPLTAGQPLGGDEEGAEEGGRGRPAEGARAPGAEGGHAADGWRAPPPPSDRRVPSTEAQQQPPPHAAGAEAAPPSRTAPSAAPSAHGAAGATLARELPSHAAQTRLARGDGPSGRHGGALPSSALGRPPARTSAVSAVTSPSGRCASSAVVMGAAAAAVE